MKFLALSSQCGSFSFPCAPQAHLRSDPRSSISWGTIGFRPQRIIGFADARCRVTCCRKIEDVDPSARAARPGGVILASSAFGLSP